MPQMAPINWFFLFVMFSLSLIMFCLMNFFSTSLSTPISKKLKISTNSMIWKW
uniref:ATP synthase complex subunit 8 n=1 Tax=Ceuthophilus sp. TaxID=3073481 RepID=A0AAU7BAU2_9ORTH